MTDVTGTANIGFRGLKDSIAHWCAEDALTSKIGGAVI